MSTYSAKFTQSPTEIKRYVLDYTQQLASGENIVSFVVNVVQNSGATTPPLVVTNLALLPANALGQVYGAAYFVSGGVTTGTYEIQFLATTSLGQVLEDIVFYSLLEKL